MALRLPHRPAPPEPATERAPARRAAPTPAAPPAGAPDRPRRWPLLLVQLAGALPGGLAALAIALGTSAGLLATVGLATLGATLGTVAARGPTRTGAGARVPARPTATTDPDVPAPTMGAAR